MKKNKIKRIVFWLLLLALVAALAAMPILARRGGGETQSVPLCATVERRSLEQTLAGGGTLQAQEPVELTLPDGVEVTRFLVTRGDLVEEGQPLAELDGVSVLSALAEVQRSLERVSEQLNEAASAQTAQTLTAQAAGRVKAVYAAPGDEVRETVMAQGALAVVSLDGLMSLDFACDMPLHTGDAVKVVCEDGLEYPGRVASAVGGQLSVTLTDDGPQLDQTAQVYLPDGTLLGSGVLAVHCPWRVLASDGVVGTVYIKEGQSLTKGARLFRLEDTGEAERSRLSEQRRAYETLLQELLVLHRSGVLTAPCAGMITQLDASLAQKTAASGTYSLRLLAGEEESAFSYVLVRVTQVLGEGFCLAKTMDWPFTIQNDEELELLFSLAEPLLENAEESLVYLKDAQSIEGEPVEALRVDDVFFQVSLGELPVKTVYLGHIEPPASEEPGEEEPGEEEPDTPIVIPIPDFDFGDYSVLLPQEEERLFPLEGTTVLAVTPRDTMRVTISVDEQDVMQYRKGMDAEISVDALAGELFHGTVTQIAAVGTNSGGSSKYAVTVELPCAGRMLPGMNASVIIHVGQSGEVLTVPVAALNDSGSKNTVYTALDEKTRKPILPVEVEIGLSDGENVEILAGLSEGQAVWYEMFLAPAAE